MAAHMHRALIDGTDHVLLGRVRIALTGWERFRGLMLRRALAPEEGLLLPDCRSVHTCFMRFPIDLAYLDGSYRVIKVVPELKPWRLSGCLKARAVLEMNAGCAERAGLRPGRRIRFEPLPADSG